MTVYVFSGPTLAGTSGDAEFDAAYLPPVEQGDVYRVTLKRPTAIGIIDGRFQDVPAVWHKEILWALAQGVPVYGSASMGALRAAELAPFGMRGVGWVFEAFRDGLLEDDDEVAVAHGSSDVGFQPMSEAMVNLRRTLSAAEDDGVIDPDLGARLVTLIKAVFYPFRSYHLLLHLGRRAGFPRSQMDALEAWLPEHEVDQKRTDALEMLRVMRSDLEAGTVPTASFTFQHTQYFERLRRSAGELVLDDLAGRVSAAEAVSLEDLLVELRLEPETYARLRDRALMRGLAVREFNRTVGMVNDDDLRETADAFRRARQLYGPEETQRWLAANHLTAGQFMSLVQDEHAVRQVGAKATGELDIHLRSQLRSDGLYPRLADRARDKRRFLVASGLDDAAATSDEVGSQKDLLRWYFGRLGTAVPDDIGAYWRSLDFADEIEFMRAVRREFWFATANRHGCVRSNNDRKEECHGPNSGTDRAARPVAAAPDRGG